MTLRFIMGGLAFFAATLLLSGCGDEGNGRPSYTTSAKPSGPATPAAPALAPVTPIASDDDPLAGPDPLAADTSTPAPEDIPTPEDDDPMIPSGRKMFMDKFGRKMPTYHTHWLRGSIFNASVAVSLNHVPLGAFRAPLDRDITMKVLPGVNTVTFTYTPDTETSSAHLDVLESEHHPPIPPLATFRSLRFGVGQVQQPITQTLTFIAR